MNIPTNHIVYIPLVLAVGFLLGYWFGARSTRQAWARRDALNLQASYGRGGRGLDQPASSAAREGASRSNERSG